MKNKKLLSKIEKILINSEVGLPISLKMKLAELILNLRIEREKKFGLFIIIGWKRKWNKFTDISDTTQDIFASHRINVMNFGKHNPHHHNIRETINFDGAILINSKGDLMHSGVVIEGMRPRIVAQKINPGRFKDLSEQFGFRKKVHLRHLTAVTASYSFKNTTIFTVSEETGDFHVFENGRILYSTVPDEVAIK